MGIYCANVFNGTTRTRIYMKKILLVSILLLTGCKEALPPFLGGGIDIKEAETICTNLGGKFDKTKIQLGVSTSLWSSSITMSFECDLSERTQINSDLQKH